MSFKSTKTYREVTMVKLIQFELKKIFKSKFNLLLLIAAIAIQCLALKEIVLSPGYLNYYIDQNTSVNQIEYKQYLDEFYFYFRCNCRFLFKI